MSINSCLFGAISQRNLFIPQSCSSESSDDEEYYYFCKLRNSMQISRAKINFLLINDAESKYFFRFSISEIKLMAIYLKFPVVVRLKSGSTCESIIVLAMVLKRLSYPNRLYDLVKFFGRSIGDTSEFIHYGILHIYNNFKQLFVWNSRRLNLEKYQEFSQIISSKQDKIPNCIGFIDGTIRPIAKPIRNQRIFYNGHKRVHCVKFQNVVTPDGIIVQMAGPWRGTRHDSSMLKETGLVRFLRSELSHNGQTSVIYGDGGYPRKDVLITPYRGAYLTEEQKDFNDKMKSVRITVEWSFGRIVNMFSFLDFKKNLKIGLQPVGEYYLVGTLFYNLHTIINKNQINLYFNSNPPTFEEYFNFYLCCLK